MKASINGKQIEFMENETILQAARRNGFFIPTLCELQDIDHTPGTCRVCLTEIKKPGDEEEILVTSCNTPMVEGMEIQTRSKTVRKQQKLQLELMLADHDQDCATCVRHGDCELQDVAQFVGLKETRFQYPEFYKERAKDESSPAVKRDMSKCIRCGRCITVCRDVQGTDVLQYHHTGLSAEIGVRDSHENGIICSDCVSCGQCTLVCPVGALSEKDDIEEVLDYLYDPESYTVVQFAPATRVALGEEFGLEPGTNVEGEMITSLKRLGADTVLDTNFSADVVIMEEGTELLHRIQHGGTLPLLTSCSPGWINYVEKNYPEMLPNVSSTKSPQQVFGAIAKTYLADRLNIPSHKMRVISIMPCTAKKEEAKRDGFEVDGRPEVDVVLTTREFARLLKREGIWLPGLEKSGYDNEWMGEYSGAAEIFGITGGVMEAAVRTVHKVLTGKELEGVEYKPARGFEGIKEATIDLGEKGKVNIAVAHELKNVQQVLEAVKKGEKEYHFIEMMTCPGGCIGGGGQPRHKQSYQHLIEERKKAIYTIDEKAKIRQSHNNPLVKKMYEEYFGEPYSSELAHKYFHTHYKDRKRVVRHTIKEIWDEISTSE